VNVYVTLVECLDVCVCVIADVCVIVYVTLVECLDVCVCVCAHDCRYACVYEYVRVTFRGKLWTTSVTSGLQNSRVGQNYNYTVYIRYFWQGDHQIYGHMRCIYNSGQPTCFRRWIGRIYFKQEQARFPLIHTFILCRSSHSFALLLCT